MAKYLRKKCGDLNEVASDNDDDKGDGDANSKDIEVVEFGKGEALTMLDSLINLKCISREERNSSCHHERQITEDKNAEQKAKPYPWLFYLRIKFVW